jgi:hypothetical protein
MNKLGLVLLVVGITNTNKNFPAAPKFITCYTYPPNLGCNGSQRAESTHPVTTTLLSHQLSLPERTPVAKGITMLLKDLDEVESESYGDLPRSLDLHTFGHLARQVTYWALEKIAGDWEECKQTVSRSTAEGS